MGMFIWGAGLVGNIVHDDVLREIRRAAAREQKKREEAEEERSGGRGKKVDKVYKIPENRLFRWIYFPHYVCEWIEWAGYWMFGGWHCVPARSFLANEIATMTPRALQGKRWYLQRFGPDKVRGRKAIIPGLL